MPKQPNTALQSVYMGKKKEQLDNVGTTASHGTVDPLMRLESMIHAGEKLRSCPGLESGRDRHVKNRHE